ncbi:MAG TPA: hypothetical protein VMT88_07880 [Actinomycetes bacterium]|nr:hypothetical protein [Actinomycetes bacterium]
MSQTYDTLQSQTRKAALHNTRVGSWVRPQFGFMVGAAAPAGFLSGTGRVDGLGAGMTCMSVSKRLAAVALTLGIAVAGSSSVAVFASVSQSAVVSENPSDVTPNIQDDSNYPDAAIYAFARSGGTMFAGGGFRKVTNASGSHQYTRFNIVSFDASTGRVHSFAPRFNGAVWAIQAKGSALYVGGEFTTVNGAAHRGLVKIDAKTGKIRSRFRPNIAYGSVTQIRLVDGRLIVGGSFPKRLAALQPHTGADTGYIDVPITGRVADNSGPTKVGRFAVNPAGTRLAAVGNFTSVGGKARRQVFMLRLGNRAAHVNKWYYEPFNNTCSAASAPVYVRDVDFSPNGDYFVVVATGYIPNSGGVGRDVCDASARFETDILSPDRPTWINYTGGDSLYSVSATGAAVYVQGHQRWLDNPEGRNNAGPGAVSREGIGAIDPDSGLALPWNPGKTREVGGKVLFAGSKGLWVGSDGAHFDGEYRSCIAFAPVP